MAQKTIYLASTDTPFTTYRGSAQGQKRAADQLKSAWEKGVPITFSTDMDYWNEKMKNAKGEWMNRGDLTINFLLTWKAAGIPAKDTLKALTTNGYKAADVYKDQRGPIKVGYFADIVARRRRSADRHRRAAPRAVRDEERRRCSRRTASSPSTSSSIPVPSTAGDGGEHRLGGGFRSHGGGASRPADRRAVDAAVR